MYQKLTAEDFRKMLEKEEDFKVDGVVVCGSGDKKKQINTLKDSLKTLGVLETNTIENEFFSSVIEFKLNNRIIWYDCVYGGAYLSELLHVACVLGSKRNIFVGSCGGLDASLKSGDIVLPTHSYGEESSTKLYARDVFDDRHFPNKELTTHLNNLISKDLKVHRGPVVTCQAMLGETEDDIQRWKEEDYLGVEMETATVFAVSNYFHIPSTALLYVADNLVKEELVGTAGYEKLKNNRDFARNHNYKLALQIASFIM